MVDLYCSNWFMCKVSHSKAVSHGCVAEEVRFLPKWTRSNSKVLAKGFKQTYISWYNSLWTLNFWNMFFSTCFFPPSRPLFSVLQYFVWPEWYSILREVEAGALASRNTTLRFRAFPINTMEKSCVPCVATIIAIAWPPQCVTCSLFAPEVRLPVHSRFICCLLTSMAELEISRA